MRPLLGRRPKRKERAPRPCLACGASTQTTWKWLCDGCFRALPALRKKEICDARAVEAPHRVFGLSRDAAEWLQAQREKRVEG